MISRLKRLRKPLLFTLIGGSVFIVGLLLQSLLVSAGMTVVEAYTIQLIVTVVLNFDLNRLITWKGQGTALDSAVKFFGSRSLTLGLSWIMFVGLVHVLGNQYHLLANAISVIAGMVVNYYLSDKWAFIPSPDNRAWMTRWASIKPVRHIVWHTYRLVKPLTVVLIAVLYWQQLYANTLWVAALLALVAGCVQYRWQTFTKRSESTLEGMKFVDPSTYSGPMHKISLIFPAFDEAEILAHSIREALNSGYPSELIEIVVTLREGQTETIEAVERVRTEFPHIVFVHVNEFAKTEKKSAQMNAVLPHLTGSIFSIVDAESKLRPGQLAAANATFVTRGLDVLQGGVQLTNLENTFEGSWLKRLTLYVTREWYVVHNSMEYRLWFSSRAFYQMARKVVALGGNTVWMHTQLIRDHGGWNDKRLTEDADLGIRMSVEGSVKFGAAYEAKYATLEHTPPKMFGKGSLFKQRVRWDQGFWQVLRDYQWLGFPKLSQRLLGLYVLATPLLQFASMVYIVTGIVQGIIDLYVPAARPPLLVTMVQALPVIPMIMIMLAQLIELPAFCRDFGHKPRIRYYVSLLVGFLPYQVFLGAPAIVAVIRQALGIESWSLTARNKRAHMQAPRVTQTLSPAGE